MHLKLSLFSRDATQRGTPIIRLWMVPMLLLVSGPPVLRGWRDPLATLRTEFDATIVWQILVYLLAGGLALLHLLRPLRRGIHARHVPLIVLSALVALLFATSSIWSPSPIATLAMSMLLVIGMLATAQFAYSGAELAADPVEILSAFRWLAGALMIAVLVAYLLNVPGMTQWNPTGVRIRGGRLGTQQILAPAVFAISLYFLAMRLRPAAGELLWIALSLVVIWFARTRAAYVTLLVAAALVWLVWIRQRVGTRALLQRAAITLVLGGAFAALALASTGVLELTWQRGGSADSVTTLSHRTTIWSWTLNQVGEHPFGFGYVTGFRQIFLGMDPIMRDAYQYQGLVVDLIGEAHNSHLELLVAAGWPGFLLYLTVLAVVAYRGIRTVVLSAHDRRHGPILALILLTICLLDGMTSSAYALPTRQSFGILLFSIGMVLLFDVLLVSGNLRRGPGPERAPRAPSVAAPAP